MLGGGRYGGENRYEVAETWHQLVLKSKPTGGCGVNQALTAIIIMLAACLINILPLQSYNRLKQIHCDFNSHHAGVTTATIRRICLRPI